MNVSPFDLLAGVALDLLLGDPRWLPHPVRIIGWVASYLERLLRWTRLHLRLAGVLFTVTIVGLTAWLVYLTLPWANIYWIYALIAIRSLDAETHRVIRFLELGDLIGARRQLSTVVGRDTADLPEEGILRAVIETMSENLSDGIIAPLFYLTVGGPAAMAAYKAINTLDSMVGYTDQRYRRFGWASARLDDLANFIPARLTAVFVWAGAAILWMDVRRSVRITLRDAASQPSPNAGYPESAFAGALRIQLGGANFYRGVEVYKPHMGDEITPLTKEVYVFARALMFVTIFLMAVVAIVVIGW